MLYRRAKDGSSSSHVLTCRSRVQWEEGISSYRSNKDRQISLADAPRVRRLSISPRYTPQSKEIEGIVRLLIIKNKDQT
jgi:hypothetical protein